MAQVLAALVRAQLLVAQPGPRGGYRLAKPAGKISVLDVVTAIDGNDNPRGCVLHDRSCQSLAGSYCGFHEILVDAQRHFLRMLQETSILEILRAENEHRAVLEPAQTPLRPEAAPDSDESAGVSEELFYAIARTYS